MEQRQNIPMTAKRIWSVIRVVFFMVRKGLCKRKLLVDLNMKLKRGKIAGGKALDNLIHHRHGHHHVSSKATALREYEFSCSNTPNYTFPFHSMMSSKRKSSNFFGCVHAPATLEDNEAAAVNAVKVVLEMLNNDMVVEASPALPGFGRSPFVRPLRITDSPFPLKDVYDEEDNGYVDKAAEEFIQKFYKELEKQKRTDVF